jgi:hypothetical protein
MQKFYPKWRTQRKSRHRKMLIAWLAKRKKSDRNCGPFLPCCALSSSVFACGSQPCALFARISDFEKHPRPQTTHNILTGGVVRGWRRRLDDAFGGAGQQQHQTQEAARYQDERATRCCGARHCCCTMLSAAARRGQPWPLAAAAMLPPETHKQGHRQYELELWWYPIIKSACA